MSWQNTIPTMVRYLISDVNSANYKYSNSRINTTILVAAQLVSLDLDFPNNYEIDIDFGSITPDPTNEETKDSSFINLISLKTACIIIGSELKTESANAISIKDGPSSIDLRGVSASLSILYKDLCDKYEKMSNDYKFTGETGSSILGPYSPGSEYISRNQPVNDFRSNYFRY